MSSATLAAVRASISTPVWPVVRTRAVTPNPTVGTARVSLTVDAPQHVRADLLDALGRRVAVVLDGAVDSMRDLLIETRGLAPGVYVLRVAGDTFAGSRQITVAR